jgi:hypothetical protein
VVIGNQVIDIWRDIQPLEDEDEEIVNMNREISQ